MTGVPAPLLALNNIEVIYDRVALAIKGASIEVPQGGMVALLGANGAGKSTLLKSISGLLKAERGEVTRGEVHFQGRGIDALPPQARVRLGIVERSGVGRAGEELGDGAFEGARAEPVDDANLSDAGTLRAIEEGFEAIEGLSDAQANHVQLDRYLLLRLLAAA